MERRFVMRGQVDLPVIQHVDGFAHECRVVNISSRGLVLRQTVSLTLRQPRLIYTLELPLDPPPAGTGVQFVMPPWPLEAHSEHELCFATYYDITSQVPAQFRDPSGTLFRFSGNELRQDPQSHHLILNRYIGSADLMHRPAIGLDNLSGHFASCRTSGKGDSWCVADTFYLTDSCTCLNIDGPGRFMYREPDRSGHGSPVPAKCR